MGVLGYSAEGHIAKLSFNKHLKTRLGTLSVTFGFAKGFSAPATLASKPTFVTLASASTKPMRSH